MSHLTDTRWLELYPDAVVIVDSDGVIVYANAMCERQLGWSPQALCGQHVECLVPGRVAHHARLRESYLAEPSERPMSRDLELGARHRDGHEVPVDIALRPFEVGGLRFVLVAIRDVTVIRKAQNRIRLLSQAIDAASQGVLITDAEGVIVQVNPAVCAMTGHEAAELIGARPNRLKSGRHDEAFYARLWNTLRAGETWQGEIINRRKDGSEYCEYQTITPVRDRQAHISHYIAIKLDVTARVQAERELKAARDELAQRVAEIERLHEQLREQAIRCPLTQLYNRRWFDETLPRELARALASGETLCLAILDLDHFKALNDSHGHATGDRALAEFGRLLLAECGPGDIACRYGGEEFALVMIGVTMADGVRRLDALRSRCADLPLSAATGPITLRFSAGVAECQPREPAMELFARADAALYAAKRAGRDRVVPALPRVGG
jgi:diguanylate cyclase (GGDEF)-like protein/PAS domain S-box-containing protein